MYHSMMIKLILTEIIMILKKNVESCASFIDFSIGIGSDELHFKMITNIY